MVMKIHELNIYYVKILDIYIFYIYIYIYIKKKLRKKHF